MEVKSGYAAIIGLPNSGKSTLLNALLKQKISITTDKPQTTRKRIVGILSEENYQIIFLDTPGILEPKYLLQNKMVEFIKQSERDADVLVFILDIKEDPDGYRLFSNNLVKQMLERKEKPRILLLNKVDLSNEEKINELIKKFADLNFEKIIPVSASLSFNMESVVQTILEHTPVHPKYYPNDDISDESERFFVAEIIREKIFEQYREEIPYSCEVQVVEFTEREGRKDFIQIEIIIEKDSQKGIIIGKGGEALKRLGKDSRADIESFLGREVFMDIRVKVRDNWRSNERMLKYFGYEKTDE